MFLVVLTAALLASVQAPPERREAASLGRPAQVAGTLLTYDSKPLLSAAVIMSPQDEAGGASVGQAQLLPDGRFTFSDVPPGRYILRARGETERNGASLFATFAVTMQGRDIGGVQMTLSPGATVRGRLEVRARHGSPPPRLTSLRVRAPLADGTAFGDTLSGTVREDGRFELTGLMAGTHVFVVEGLVFPWRIAEARLRGRDVTESAFDIDRDEEFRGTRLILADTAAGVSGTVSLPSGVNSTDLLVVAFPGNSFWRRVPLRFVRTGRVAPDGSYRVVDLAPGDYLVIAAPLKEQDAMRGEVLDRLAPRAERVRLGEAQVSRVSLQAAAPAPGTIP